METGPGAALVTTPFLTSQEPLEIQLIITFTSPMLVTYPSLNCLISTSTS